MRYVKEWYLMLACRTYWYQVVRLCCGCAAGVRRLQHMFYVCMIRYPLTAHSPLTAAIRICLNDVCCMYHTRLIPIMSHDTSTSTPFYHTAVVGPISGGIVHRDFARLTISSGRPIRYRAVDRPIGVNTAVVVSVVVYQVQHRLL